MLVYDYHPLATTLYEKYFARPDLSNYSGIRPDVLWSYVTQLTSAIKAVHSAGLAVRVIEASKILLTGQNRYFNISNFCVYEVIVFESIVAAYLTFSCLMIEDLFSITR